MAGRQPARLLPAHRAGASSRSAAGPGRRRRPGRHGDLGMKWATRAGVHIDRAACAWLIRRALDADAEFVFVTDPVLWKIAEIVHEADLDDERFDAPEAAGLDVVLRGLSMTGGDERTLAVSGPIFDGLYEYHRRRLLLGREPA